METVLKELHGFSGSKIYLMKDSEKVFVRKIGNVERNFERLTALEKYSVPKIYRYDGECLDLEYIHGLDIGNYLTQHSIDNLQDFILTQLEEFSLNTIDKDYTKIYHNKISWVDDRLDLPFTSLELIDRLPKILPSSEYHGDMTLENILFSNNEFFLIDGTTTEYDSYIFDIAKLRQDLECKWFLRNDNLKIDVKVNSLQHTILEKYPLANDDFLLILMLLRVLAHASVESKEYKLLTKEINRLWKTK